MMGIPYGNQQYKEQSINTMTKGEMLILLYSEAIKHLTKARIFGDREDYDVFEDEINRTREIIDYLTQTLDWKYPISADLAKLYDFINYELARAKAGHNTEIIGNVLPFIIEFRDTWTEADRMSKGMTVNGQ